MTEQFDAFNWKKRFDHNADEAERNSMMDSGWSKQKADDCIRKEASLWRELVVAIAATDTKPQDFFERPDLVAIQEAARYAVTPARAALRDMK